MKGEDILRPLIVENGEVLLLQAENRCARFVRHLNVDCDYAVWAGWWRDFGLGSARLKLGLRSALRGSVLSRGGRKRQKQD
jgi:hypothetical protein